MAKMISDFPGQPDALRLDGNRIHYLMLCQRVCAACCNDSSEPLERLLRSFQRDEQFFQPPSPKRDKLQYAANVMRFFNAYLYFKFAELNGGCLLYTSRCV